MIVTENDNLTDYIEELLNDIAKYGRIHNIHKIENSIAFDYDNYSATGDDVRIMISPTNSGAIKIEGPSDIVNKIIRTIEHDRVTE